jgi:hypothetical protein
MPTNNPIIDGIMDGLLIREHMAKLTQDQGEYDRRMAADQRAQQEFENNIVNQRRQYAHQQKQDQLQDINTRLALGTNPALVEVPPGEDTRSVQLPLDPSMQRFFGGIPALSMNMPLGKTIEYGDRTYAIRSADELENDRLRELAATNAAALKKFGAEKSLEQQLNQVYVPGLGYVDKSVAPSFINSASREEEGAKNRAKDVTVAGIRAGATRDQTAASRQSNTNQLRTELLALEKEEAAKHEERRTLGGALLTGKYFDPAKMSEIDLSPTSKITVKDPATGKDTTQYVSPRRQQVQAAYQAATDRVTAIQKRKAEIVRELQGQPGTGAATAAPGAIVAPPNPYRQAARQ